MNRRSIILFFLVFAMTLAALPAAAFTRKDECNGHWTRWRLNSETLNVGAGVSQFWTDAWRASIGTAAGGWNDAPGTNFKIYYRWTLAGLAGASGDGSDDMIISTSADWQYGDAYAAVTKHVKSDCDGWNPFDVAHYTEVDVVLNPKVNQWDKSAAPIPSDNMLNTTLIIQHELGHVMGLGDENGVLARMNSGWPGPQGGPVGNNNEVQVLGDDARGARNAYGTAVDVRDVAASAVYMVSPGVSRVIPAPGSTFRGAYVYVPFTILNRGTTDETIPVHFYLSPTRYAAPGNGYYLGSATISLQYARMTTGTASLLIPNNAPTGYQYIGWYTDPYNGIAEGNETNNGVALVSSTYVSPNRVPIACFTATPTTGYAPLTVNFNASCSSDADGDGLIYEWDFGDGTTGSGQTTSHRYYYQGYFTATLTVRDPSNATSSTSRSIGVACSDSRFCAEEPY